MPPSYTSTWHPSKRHHHHKRRPHRVQRNYRTTGVRYMAADNEHCTAQNTVPFLRAHDANVWRYIVSDNAAEFADGVPCVQAARAAGYKVFLSVKFPDADTPAQATAVIAQTVATYGQPWALSVGNEENMTSATYVADWNAAAVWLEQHAPSTIRVFGEYYPWRFTWLTNGMKLRPVGVQVVSTHCYYRGQTADGLLGIPALAKALERYRAPLWCSEMAPVLNAPAFFANQTLGQYDQDVRRVERESPNLQLVSWYEWPGIGAVTPGFGPPAPATGPGPVY